MKNKVKVIILTLAFALTSNAQQFNETVYNVNTGRIQIINGKTEKPYQPHQPQIDMYNKIVANRKKRDCQNEGGI